MTDVPAMDQFEKLFRHRVLRMLQDEDAVDNAVVASMLAWHNTGFGAHVGAEIAAADSRGRENVARCLCHPPVALGRIMAQDSAARVVCTSDSSPPRSPAPRPPPPRLPPPLPRRRPRPLPLSANLPRSQASSMPSHATSSPTTRPGTPPILPARTTLRTPNPRTSHRARSSPARREAWSGRS
ncbi:MAG: hypothetical protein IT452_12405 [Planctomycetia bacterium]|nr:hypothetical protein [Planctomycetia bacterium]